jgi:glycosyltransferase involved in cell wall biosynthesis
MTATVGRTGARILEVATYPPPRSGWAVRVEFLKRRLEQDGHECVVLNLGANRAVPSADYETVLGGFDFVRKVWRYSRRDFVVHAHANGDAPKGAVLALVAAVINLLCGRRCFLTFHAGAIQRYFPRERCWWLAPLYWLLFTIPVRVICNSDAVKQRINGYGIAADKIIPIPAFSTQYLEYTPAPLPARLEAFFRQFPVVVFTYVRMRRLFFPLTMVDAMAEVMKRRPNVGLVLCGGLTHMDDGLWDKVQARIQANGLENRICQIDDLDHDVFLTALRRSALYLRTPITDGVASSVMEALALHVPVVASENGTRPAGVVTYPAEDAALLATTVEHVLDNRVELVSASGSLDVADTLTDEVALLTAS